MLRRCTSRRAEASFRGSRLRTKDALVLAGGDELDFRTPRMMDVVAVTVDWTALADYADKVEQCDILRHQMTAELGLESET